MNKPKISILDYHLKGSMDDFNHLTDQAVGLLDHPKHGKLAQLHLFAALCAYCIWEGEMDKLVISANEIINNPSIR